MELKAKRPFELHEGCLSIDSEWVRLVGLEPSHPIMYISLFPPSFLSKAILPPTGYSGSGKGLGSGTGTGNASIDWSGSAADVGVREGTAVGVGVEEGSGVTAGLGERAGVGEATTVASWVWPGVGFGTGVGTEGVGVSGMLSRVAEGGGVSA